MGFHSLWKCHLAFVFQQNRIQYFRGPQVLTQQKRTYIECLKPWNKTKHIKIQRKNNRLWCHSTVKLHVWLALPHKFSERATASRLTPNTQRHYRCQFAKQQQVWILSCMVASNPLSKVIAVCCCDCDCLCFRLVLHFHVWYVYFLVCLSVSASVCLSACLWGFPFPFHHKQLKTLMSFHSRTHTHSDIVWENHRATNLVYIEFANVKKYICSTTSRQHRRPRNRITSS